jgi:carboxyl-terminal processing protease
MKNSDNKIILLVFIMCMIFFSGGYIIGINSKNSLGSISSQFKFNNVFGQKNNNLDLNLYWEVYQQLEKEYISNNIDRNDLLYGSIKGMVNGLNDPYTNFLDPDEAKDYFNSNKGEFEGIGATLKQSGEYVAVESPIDGSPAQIAGMLPNDIIIEVQDEDMRNKSVYTVASKIRGEAGTKVKIKIYRESSSDMLDLIITRQKIVIDNIQFKIQKDNIVELKILKFTDETPDIFNRKWDQIVNEILLKKPKAIVIDLRNNPGGFVNSVEYVLEDFLNKGDLLYMEEDKRGRQYKYQSTRNGKLSNIPIVVIVNEGSASASEIFAGAIQDHNRGKVIGQKTVGKGVEQKLVRFNDGSLLQVVFQKWLTPNGKNITSSEPINPDVLIEGAQNQMDQAYIIID